MSECIWRTWLYFESLEGWVHAHQSQTWTKAVNYTTQNPDLGRSFAHAHKAVPSQVASVELHFQDDITGPGAGQRFPPSPTRGGRWG